MKTECHSINDVLAKNATSFFIPPFQRAYAWGRPEIERYFSDILRIIESELDPKQYDKRKRPANPILPIKIPVVFFA